MRTRSAAARATSTSGPRSPPRRSPSCARAGLLALTAPVEFGGAGLWSEGRYRPYYELLEALARIDSVTAQLLQVHSHALGIVSGLASDEQRRRLLPEIVSAGKLLASVGSEAKPSGKLADIARTELEELPGGGYRLTCQKYFASLAPAADELLIWTAVPGAGPYAERSIDRARAGRRPRGRGDRPVGCDGDAGDRQPQRPDQRLRGRRPSG